MTAEERVKNYRERAKQLLNDEYKDSGYVKTEIAITAQMIQVEDNQLHWEKMMKNVKTSHLEDPQKQEKL